MTYKHRTHAIYNGVKEGHSNADGGYDYFPLIASGNKMDHNCMRDLNGKYGLENNPNWVNCFESAVFVSRCLCLP